MGELNVYFVGVCVHVREVAEATHRVVVLNASNGDTIHRRQIEPHRAKLDIGAVGTPAPNGVIYTIANATTRIVDYDPSFERCIPRLAEFTKEKDLPALSDAVVHGKDKTRAAAYFDAVGTFFGEVTSGGASVARLVVKTDGPPRLRVSPFESDLFPEETVSLSDSDTDTVTIAILNVADRASAENDFDFLLNFRILENIPEDAWWPTEPRQCKASNRDYGSIGPGCSNSAYP
jgi:hypothetical protein